MERFAPSTRKSYFGYVFIGFLTCLGCGSDAKVAQDPGKSAEVAATIPSPTDIVSQFLDEVRRGGDDSRANDLLTEQARKELARIGQSIQPIGSPAARFDVTRSENVPGDEKSALVHSVWSEPKQDGMTDEFQVVWAVQRETAGWRISGLAMELEANQPPMIVDFENSEMMASLLAPSQQPANSSKEAQAAAPNAAISR